MGEVIKLGGGNDGTLPVGKRVWQCAHCGSQNFFMYEDGSTECAFCMSIGTDYGGDWREHITMADHDKPFHEAARTSIQSPDVDFGKARAMRAVTADTVVIALIYEDGNVHCWDALKRPKGKQLVWLDGRLAALRVLITGEIE